MMFRKLPALGLAAAASAFDDGLGSALALAVTPAGVANEPVQLLLFRTCRKNARMSSGVHADRNSLTAPRSSVEVDVELEAAGWPEAGLGEAVPPDADADGDERACGEAETICG
ncbi:MAG TPA: hypothetical protein VK009_18380 [Chloroflexota bacterium]|nr:hypothetical protein [Chloroflexota bacterium]